MAAQATRAVSRSLMLGCALISAAVAGSFVPARAEFANPDGVAVIIGNRTYQGDIPDVEFAHRDAEAFRRYVVDVLGFDPENVIDLRDATQAEMWSTFGSRATADRSELWSYLDPDGRSDVVVFYSGHGAPGLEDKRGYLLPVNADPNTAELNGYPIDVLYENLSSLEEARSVAVYLDACFSGGSGGGGMLIRSASPVYVGADLPAQAGERLSVLTAATGEQLASWDHEAGHGLFTHHLLDALYGKSDADTDGRVTAREAKAYLDRHMTRAARRTYKRRQRVSFTGNADTVLAAFAGGRGFPDRPELALVETQPATEDLPAGGSKTAPATGAGQVAVSAPAAPAASAPAVPSSLTPREVEAGLGLLRQDRRLIQHALNALDFDVGGADGKFGPRTRRGIRGWQSSKGYSPTGYLTGGQVAALEPFGRAAQARANVEAERRERERLTAARNEADAKRKAADAKRKAADDDAFAWARTLGTVAGYDEYLGMFPDGIHVAEARRERDALRHAETLKRQAADDDAFVRAKAANTAAGYHEYLLAFPRGRHVAEARGLRDRRQAEEQQATQALKVFGTIMGGILNRR
ncbi:MAG: caspase family protein [Immundisolibacterales bacterium]|nr:caspase family protein [Immundisolibacterales bacterium]